MLIIWVLKQDLIIPKNMLENMFFLCQMPVADAMTISNTIYDTLQRLSIPLNNIISYSFDGANVMSRNNASV